MKLVLCVLAVLVLPDVPIASAVNVCAKPPAASLMLKVLRPTAKVLLDCVADVLILHRVNATFLAKEMKPEGYANGGLGTKQGIEMGLKCDTTPGDAVCKVVTVVCEYHIECYQGLREIKDTPGLPFVAADFSALRRAVQRQHNTSTAEMGCILTQMHERRRIAGERFLKKFATLYPASDSDTDGKGIQVIKEMMACLHGSPELEFEDDDVTNAVMHWIYEVLRTDA